MGGGYIYHEYNLSVLHNFSVKDQNFGLLANLYCHVQLNNPRTIQVQFYIDLREWSEHVARSWQGGELYGSIPARPLHDM